MKIQYSGADVFKERPADCDRNADPLNYIISDGGKTILYAHDAGYFKEEVWRYLTERKFRFDFVSLDCAGIPLPWRSGHMGIEACSDVRERMLDIGLADEKTVFCVNHFSQNGGLIYDELIPVMEKRGMLVSFDGMVVELEENTANGS